MSNAVDPTNAMPEAGTTSVDQIGDLMHSMMTGVQSNTVVPEEHVPDIKLSNTSDLESVIDANETSDSNVPEVNADVNTEVSAEPDFLELKVKGYKEPVKVPKNFEDPKVLEYLNKGARFDKRIEQLANQQKELQAKLANLSDYESKAELADQVEAAKKLMAEGYSEHALGIVLGDSAQDFLDSLVEERIKYREASPEQRMQMDLERQKRNEQLQRQRDADRIAKLEAQINSRSEQVREAEFSGYIEDAKGRYDLGQWIEDDSVAGSLNDMLHSAAMSDIIKLQRQREARGEENISQRDIRRAYANRAKILINGYRGQAEKTADQKIEEQAQVATKNAQVASTKNYGQADIAEQWKKSGGTMSDLVNMFRQKGSVL